MLTRMYTRKIDINESDRPLVLLIFVLLGSKSEAAREKLTINGGGSKKDETN